MIHPFPATSFIAVGRLSPIYRWCAIANFWRNIIFVKKRDDVRLFYYFIFRASSIIRLKLDFSYCLLSSVIGARNG